MCVMVEVVWSGLERTHNDDDFGPGKPIGHAACIVLGAGFGILGLSFYRQGECLQQGDSTSLR